MPFTNSEREAFFDGYVECALWSSTHYEDEDDSGTPMDDIVGADDLADEAKASIREECDAFLDGEYDDLLAYCDERSLEHAGHDFWLTRNGHGAGFWDRGLGELGGRLSNASKPYGSCDLYIGDDGKVYSS